MSTLGFASSAVCSAVGDKSGSANSGNTCSSRVSRRGLLNIAGALIAGAALPRNVDAALVYGKPSTSDLLQKMQVEKTEEEIAAEKEARAEARRARLERQRQLADEAAERKAQGTVAQNDSEIEANLRANYYYPTARKRYLPRVKRANEEVPLAMAAVREGRWPDVSTYVNGSLDDLVLPMKLYASSLAGQGLSLAAKFVQNMAASADTVEASVKKLKKATKRQDTSLALASLKEIEQAIASFRENGRLEAADFGIGEVPTDAKVGSGLGNNNPALYNRNFAEAGIRGPQS